MYCFKYHQNQLVNEEFDFQGAKFFQGALRGAERPDFKNSKKPRTERRSQPTPKISAFQLN